MKSFFKTAICLVFLVLISAPVMAKDKFKAVTSFTVIADMATSIAGDAAIVESITKPGAEIHDYQPTPKDILRAQNADIILWNGLNLERWFERFLKDIDDVPSIIVSEDIEPLSIYGGAYDGKPNPHAWMSTKNALIYVENIRRAFVTYDPDNAEIYNTNAKSYAEKISALQEEYQKALEFVPQEQKYLVTSEGAFSYLARDLDMKELYLWPINADQQGTPQQVKQLIDLVHENNIPVIFSESTISDKPAKQVAAETGILYGGILYVDSLSEADGAVPTYLDLLSVTINRIIAGFEKAYGAKHDG